MDMDEGAVRYTQAVLVDDSQSIHKGDFILESDGGWHFSKGDEDVLETIDGKNRLITRSLQNWHTHLAMQLNARDFSDGLHLEEWLQKSIFPTEKNLDPEMCSIGVKAAAAEMIRNGCSFANDMYHFPEAIGPVLEKAGLRGIVSGPITNWPPSDDAETGEAKRRLQNLLSNQEKDSKVSYGVASHSVYTCSEETLLSGKELAEKYDSPLHIHVSETRKEVAECYKKHGLYPIEYLDKIDYFIEDKVRCAHGSWVKKNEMRLLKKHLAKVIHCPSSNMKLACGGTLSLEAYNEAGVDVRIGTDGSASNGNGLNMLHEARTAILVQRHDHWNASALTAKDAFKMATRDSQDWAAWNLDDIRMQPVGRSNNRHISNLIYNGAERLDLMVEGVFLRKNGETCSMDEKSIIQELNTAVNVYYDGVE